jgi:hypothetical protein
MRSFMELIYIDSEEDARQTNMQAQGATDAETWRLFNSYRKHSVDIKQASFLLDYHNRKGDLADTIAIDDVGFTAITGKQPKSDAEYRNIDASFWASVQESRELVGAG